MDNLNLYFNIGGSSLFLISSCKKYILKKIRNIHFVDFLNEINSYKILSKLNNFKNIIPKFYGIIEINLNKYIILENIITYNLNYCAILDFKIGIGQHKLYSSKLKGKKKNLSYNKLDSIIKGIQLHGLKNKNFYLSKKKCKIFNYDYYSLKNIFELFLLDNNIIRYDLILQFINKLTIIADNISIKDPLFDSSILLIWCNNKVMCKLIDFGKFNCKIYKQFYPNNIYNFNRGIYYLINILFQIYKENI